MAYGNGEIWSQVPNEEEFVKSEIAINLLSACYDAAAHIHECTCPLGDGGRGDAGCLGTCVHARLSMAIIKAEASTNGGHV